MVEDDAFGPDSSLLKMRLNSVVVMRLGDSSREEGGQEAAFTRTDKERGGGGGGRIQEVSNSPAFFGPRTADLDDRGVSDRSDDLP